MVTIKKSGSYAFSPSLLGLSDEDRNRGFEIYDDDVCVGGVLYQTFDFPLIERVLKVAGVVAIEIKPEFRRKKYATQTANLLKNEHDFLSMVIEEGQGFSFWSTLRGLITGVCIGVDDDKIYGVQFWIPCKEDSRQLLPMILARQPRFMSVA